MRIATTLVTTLMIAAAFIALHLAPPAAQACPTCARHNTSTGDSNTDGEHNDGEHAHLDEDEGFMTILGPGHTDGWSFDEDWIRIENGTIIAGSMDGNIPSHRYAVYEEEYYNFELRLQVKIEGPPRANGGIQVRSEVRANGNDMAGYQADMGHVYWGRIYDQSRRNSLLSAHPEGYNVQEEINQGDWNDYVIRCEGSRIQIWINGTQTADYTEQNEEFADVAGQIGLQMHSGPPSLRYYRNIRIRELD